MPWQEVSKLEERLRFIARLLDGEGMSGVCREFGISRKTGYKIWNRYQRDGMEALCDRSRRPVRYANQLPEQVERLIVSTRKDKPHWGARKIREILVRQLAGDVRIPAQSTPEPAEGTCGSGPARPCQQSPQEAARQQGRRHTSFDWSCPKRSLGRRFQGRVQAGQPALLLPFDGHRPRVPLSSELRGL